MTSPSGASAEVTGGAHVPQVGQDGPPDGTVKPGHDPSVPLSVSCVAERLERIVAAMVQRAGAVWIAGEVSDLRRRPRGHLWFCLRDATSRVDCVWWDPPRAAVAGLDDGMQVLVRATPRVLTRNTRVVCDVREVRPTGQGAGARALEELRSRLRHEGLFDAARKRRVPRVPRAVAVITAPDSAAWHDVLATARRRHAGIPVILVPALMQSAGAPESIRAALGHVERSGQFDAVILTRGGGSTADLAAFDDEALVRAIAGCRVPVVTAIGHEVDYSTADAVADRREATPTAAAVFVIPDRRELDEEVRRRRATMADAMARRLEREHARVRLAERTIADSALLRVEAGYRRVDRVRSTMHRGLQQRLSTARARLDRAREGIGRGVLGQLENARRRLTDATQRLERARGRLFETEQSRLRRLVAMLTQSAAARVSREVARHERVAAQLAALDPLSVLRRGYAVVRDVANQVVISAMDFEPEQLIQVQLQDGVVLARVVRARPAGPRSTSEDPDHAERVRHA